MSEVEIEEAYREQGTLIRSCKVKVAGRTLITPTRAIGVTQSDRKALDVASPLIDSHFVPFGEVYARITLDFLSRLIDEDEVGQNFSSKLSNRISQLKDAGAVPYLTFALVNNDGNPYNRIPSQKILDLLFNFLWGTPGNSIIVPPLLGVLQDEKEYAQFIAALEERYKASVDRKSLPIMAVVPSAYRLIAPKLLERYWKIGCRIFAFNFENKKYGAFGYAIEKLHSELNELSKQDGETYILHALNSKLRTGRGETNRINDLLAAGFGFDSYGPGHGSRQRWVPPTSLDPTKSNYLFDNKTYGFFSLSDIITNKATIQADSLNTNVFKTLKASSISNQPSYKIREICSGHNLEKNLREVQIFPKLINNEELVNYFSKKEKILNETKRMKGIYKKVSSPTWDKWFE